MKRFYFIASFFNLIIIILFFILMDQGLFRWIEILSYKFTQFVSDSRIHYIEPNRRVDYGLHFYVLFFWWITPFSIFIINDYSKHLIYFLGINVFTILWVASYTFRSDFETTLYSVAIFTMISIPISILIYYAQKLVGRKFLPTLYP